VVVIVCPGAFALTSVWGAGYENHEKMGIPKDVDPIHETYLPVVQEQNPQTLMQQEIEQKDQGMERQRQLLERRYDLSHRPSDVMMSGGKKPVQQGVRVKLPDGVTWEALAAMPPQEIRQQGMFPNGFLPLPHAKHETGGQVFPQTSRAFRKSITSRLARLPAANQRNHGGLVVRKGQNNLVRIYEMLY
jgi:hypothetical protein